MIHKLKHLIIGSPLRTSQIGEKQLNKIRALAAFSPDALSSIAYANQEIYLGLVIAGSAGLSLSFPIALTITGLLVIVALSYGQTIPAYPSGGGSYIVARENLGTIAGLVAAGALMVDYILTAAVSLTAGVAAIASAFPALWPYKIWIALGILVLITLANLRGMQETGTLMSIPVYLFLATFIPMLIYGGYQLALHGSKSLAAVAPAPLQPLGLLLVLHAFATGCTALTGVEAISNGITAFKPPQPHNARITLIIMAFLMGLMFFGSIGLTQYLAVIPRSNEETILSALSRQVLGENFLYILVQISTLSILAVAANTSFAGFPRVAAILANDRFLPRQLNALGDRLVYNNGILILALATAGLIVLFKGDSHLLVPLFAIGAFLAFTLSQSGMVVHWFRLRGGRWLLKACINGLGAIVTGATLVIIGVSKFAEGAWISILIIPLLVIGFYRIRSHYIHVAEQLTLRGLPPSLKPFPPPRVVVPVSGVHRGLIDAVNFARSITDKVTAVYVELDPGSGEAMQKTWMKWWPDVPLVVIPSPYRSLVEPLLKYLDEADQAYNDGQQAVLVLPEFIPARIWQTTLHNQTASLIKNALLYQRRERGFQRVIIDVPYHLKE